MKKYIYILFLIPLFFSCEKDANVDIPVTKPQLVTACFAGANEDSIRLKLSWTSPIFYTSSTNLADVKGAKIVLSKGNQQYIMKWDSVSSTYIASNTFFKKNDAINLDITFKSEKITSSCVIPSKSEYTMAYKGIIESVQEDYVTKLIAYNFTNNSTDANNYYRILFEGYYTDNYSHMIFKNELYCENGELFSFAPGESQELNLYFSSSDNYKLDSIRYYVIHCSEDYYKYHKSVYNYEGDDFFVEPSIIYNNVEGGIGIFSSYNMRSDTTIIR